jgi:hypothetical protein
LIGTLWKSNYGNDECFVLARQSKQHYHVLDLKDNVVKTAWIEWNSLQLQEGRLTTFYTPVGRFSITVL